MNPVFVKHYSIYKERFEFSNDNHWNELGHELVAKEIKDLLRLKSNF